MENTTIKDVVLDKKLEHYNLNEHDCLASSELTVTITLGEYRKLVENCATANVRIREAEDDRYERTTQNESLKKENDELKAELYELQKKFSHIESEPAEAELEPAEDYGRLKVREALKEK